MDIGSRVFIRDQVVFIDAAIGILVYKTPSTGLPSLSYTCSYTKNDPGISHSMNSNIVTGTTIYSSKTHTNIVRVIIYGKLGNLIFVVCNVVTHLPIDIFTYDGTSRNAELHTFVYQLSHIGEQLIAEVGTRGNRNGVQKVGSRSVINIKAPVILLFKKP